MILGQTNLKEATKYSQFYKYKVAVTVNNYSNKLNYIFRLDNNFFKKILNNPSKRLEFNHAPVSFQRIVFTYTPTESRKMMKDHNGDDILVHFSPFEIIVTSEDCHDLIYFHTHDQSNKKEILKAVYILDIEKVVNKLNKILDDTYISDKGKTNMVLSIRKHLADVQSESKYGVTELEEYCGLTEDNARIIMDDYEDSQVLNSLVEYVL